MSDKLEKIARELDKAKRKRAEFEKRVRELEDKYREQENTEIHDMVREANLTPEALALLIEKSKKTLPETPGNRLKDYEETEDTDNEN